MASDDQERFEDYLELERYIEELQAGRPAHPPRDLTPEQARIYRMAAFFRSAAPEATTPRAEFVAELRQRLLELDEEEENDDTVKLPAVRPASKSVHKTTLQPIEQPDALPSSAPQQDQPGLLPSLPAVQAERAKKRLNVSRRTLLTGGAAAAASLAAGTGLGMAVGYNQAGGGVNGPQLGSTAQKTWPPQHLLPQNEAVEWLAVTTLSQLQQVGRDALFFNAGTVVGYVILSDGDDDEKAGEVIAMSAACTHMGCIVQWNAADRQYHCPCHNGVFGEYGKPNPVPNGIKYYTSLPRMDTVIIGDTVYVGVPKKKH